MKPTFMTNIGNFIKDVLTKFWIWVVAIMLFVIGLGGEKVVLYRIVYMALFLIFILTFQVCGPLNLRNYPVHCTKLSCKK